MIALKGMWIHRFLFLTCILDTNRCVSAFYCALLLHGLRSQRCCFAYCCFSSVACSLASSLLGVLRCPSCYWLSACSCCLFIFVVFLLLLGYLSLCSFVSFVSFFWCKQRTVFLECNSGTTYCSKSWCVVSGWAKLLVVPESVPGLIVWCSFFFLMFVSLKNMI